MANIKSAKKRINTILRQTLENKRVKTEIHTLTKKYKASVDAGEKETAMKLYSETVSVIDSAVSKNIISKNSADRKKSRLAIYANKAN
ncbi:MAG: 30S ribosomal protein S20 [Clostridia bacterium]|nr:30S ribosomal protein S20 [Clostridia bacterium]